MSKKVPFSVRMEAVKRVQLGESLREVSRAMKLDATEISVWLYLLEHEGPNIVRLHPRVHANYSLRCQGNRIKIYQLRTFADGRPTVEMGLAVTHPPLL